MAQKKEAAAYCKGGSGKTMASERGFSMSAQRVIGLFGHVPRPETLDILLNPPAIGQRESNESYQ